jgi:hypothetical protein
MKKILIMQEVRRKIDAEGTKKKNNNNNTPEEDKE